VAGLLARRFRRAAHIEADRLQQLVVSGGLWPDQEPREEALRQLDLRARNAAALAAGFMDAGIVAVVDDVVVGPERLAVYRRALAGRELQLVVLAPRLEVALARDAKRRAKHVGDRWAHLDAEQRTALAGNGLWIDTSELSPEQTVESILERWPAGPAASERTRVTPPQTPGAPLRGRSTGPPG
jgi:chloramphenicol 3-O-phosphotransferase